MLQLQTVAYSISQSSFTALAAPVIAVIHDELYVAPVLSTELTRFDRLSGNDISRPSLRIVRQLKVLPSAPVQSRQYYQEQFEKLQKRELSFQDLASDISCGVFCRTYVVDTAVYLEKDIPAVTAYDLLESMNSNIMNVQRIVAYLSKLHRHTSKSTSYASNLASSDGQDVICKASFDSISADSLLPLAITFDHHFKEALAGLRESFVRPSSTCVVHGCCRPENIVMFEYGGDCPAVHVSMYSAELSHVGNPAYDVGVIVGNLLLWHYIHMSNPENNDQRREFCHSVEDLIRSIIDSYIQNAMPDNLDFLSLVAGYAGVEMIFRLRGASWLPELPFNEHLFHDAGQSAERLIRAYQRIKCSSQLVNIALMLL